MVEWNVILSWKCWFIYISMWVVLRVALLEPFAWGVFYEVYCGLLASYNSHSVERLCALFDIYSSWRDIICIFWQIYVWMLKVKRRILMFLHVTIALLDNRLLLLKIIRCFIYYGYISDFINRSGICLLLEIINNLRRI